MLARCQVGLCIDGACLVIMTYPIKGYPWRRNPMKTFNFQLPRTEASELFVEVESIRKQYPDECLTDGLWSDMTEKANGITRDVATNTLCYTIGIYDVDGQSREYYSLKEDSDALLESLLHKTVTRLVAEFEFLPLVRSD